MTQNRRPQVRHGFGAARTIGDLRRTKGTHTPGRSILIVCEGAKTETRYFSSLAENYRLATIKVTIVGEGEAPISVVDHALSLRDERARHARKNPATGASKYDEVWCVFDTEQLHNNPSFHRAVDKARANGLRLAVSNPAFEFWLLLHFQFTTRAFHDCDDVISVLTTHIPNYQKGGDHFPVLAPNVETAIVHARRAQAQLGEDELFPNPSTDVYQLVEVLRSMKRF